MTTRSKDEALDLLEAFRAELIDAGRAAAVELARKNGTVHSRQVRAALATELAHYEGTDCWLGAVFGRQNVFEWTGRYHTYSDGPRNCHKKTTRVWRLVAAKTHKVLVAARELLADESTWTKGSLARDERGVPVQPQSPSATRCSALGAIYLLAPEGLAAASLIELTLEMGGDIQGFNDKHAHGEVLAAFDRVIARTR